MLNPTDDMKIMKDEIFGPLLPVKTYDTVDDAIGYVNDHPRPLGLYYFGATLPSRTACSRARRPAASPSTMW